MAQVDLQHLNRQPIFAAARLARQYMGEQGVDVMQGHRQLALNIPGVTGHVAHHAGGAGDKQLVGAVSQCQQTGTGKGWTARTVFLGIMVGANLLGIFKMNRGVLARQQVNHQVTAAVTQGAGGGKILVLHTVTGKGIETSYTKLAVALFLLLESIDIGKVIPHPHHVGITAFLHCTQQAAVGLFGQPLQTFVTTFIYPDRQQ
ncbi:hypothetical protein CBR65_14690 [Cellvibrio sp. PSBB006]|nr:hypothetical protein CBR65_14690 [Cellvibrio sp. PSBB006]